MAGSVAACLLSLLTPAFAYADTLALLTSWNLDGSKSAWWVGDAPSNVDGLLRRGDAPVGGLWLDPEPVLLATPPSKLFLRYDLSVNNGRALAGLYGATHVLVGKVQWEVAEGVSFVGLQAVRARVEGTWAPVAEQTTLGNFQVAVTGFGATAADAAAQASRLLEFELRRAKPNAPAAVPPTLDAAEDELVVEVEAPASAYVAFLRRLRELDKGIIDFSEVWATEGAVCLHLELDEETPDARIARALDGLVTTPQEGFSLRSVRRDASRRVTGVVLGPAPAPAPAQAPR